MIKIDEDDPVGELEPSFPYRDVQIRRGVDLKEFYDLQSEIGRGKFGTVYKCKEKATGLFLAAKIVSTCRKEDKRNVEREIDIMRALQHPRLIQLYDAFEKDKTMVVVLELIEGGELFERVIGDDFVLTEKSCTAFMRQICEGMEFIHQQNILHLDMKPENILCLTKTGNRIKIIDFGLARKFDPDKKLQILFGTPEFVAPEVVNFDRIGFGTDMWSIGVICYVLLSGLSPFMGETDIETMANVTIAKWDFEDEAFAEISEEAKDFISNLLVKEKEKRLSATQCLLHPWLRRKPLVSVQKTPSSVKVEPSPSELDLAKDNLKFFVERWNEHPNSPYIFDTSCQTISPCVSFNNIPDRRSRNPSLSGYSPSPCDSISLADADFSESPPISPRSISISNHLRSGENSPTASPVNRYLDRLHIFDRRASDSLCTAKNASELVNRINLAEEIKKLSDKLLKINQITNNGSSSGNIYHSNENNHNDVEELAFSYESENERNSFMLKTTAKVLKKFSKSESQSDAGSDAGFSIGKSSFFYSATSSTHETNQEKLISNDLTFPRRKFKFSNRDVPTLMTSIATEWDNLSDTSSTLSSAGHSNLSTPDIPIDASDHSKNLIHLLGKRDEIFFKSEKIRRSSLGFNWPDVETLGQRTVKSISSFLMTSKNSDPKSNSTTP